MGSAYSVDTVGKGVIYVPGKTSTKDFTVLP